MSLIEMLAKCIPCRRSLRKQSPKRINMDKGTCKKPTMQYVSCYKLLLFSPSLSTHCCCLFVCFLFVFQKTIGRKGIGTQSKKHKAPEITDQDRIKAATEVLKNTIKGNILDWWKRLQVSLVLSLVRMFFRCHKDDAQCRT